MSEEENKKEKQKDTKEEGIDVVDENVALLKSKIITLERDNAELEDKNQSLAKKLEKALAFVEGDKKKMLLEELVHKVDMPEHLLMLKSYDELKEIKKTVDMVKGVSFKSSRPVHSNRDDPRKKLDSMHSDYMKRTYGGNK